MRRRQAYGQRGVFLVFTDPASPDFTDSPVNIGVQWATTVPGLWTGNRLYIATSGPGGAITVTAYNEDTHTLMASVAGGTPGGGYLVVPFAAPVAVVPGVNYVAAYHTPLKYAFTGAYPWPASSAGGELVTGGANAGRFTNGAVAEPVTSTAVNFYVSPVVVPA